jgi:polyisoprenoid-binding protein YceI
MSRMGVVLSPLPWLLVLATGAPLEARPETYVVDPASSHVRIHLGRAGLVKFLGHEHHIEAPVADGRIEVVNGDPARSRVSLRFEAARLAVVPGSESADDIPKVEERMRGPEVLDVTRYPEISFASTSVTVREKNGSSVRAVVAGTLILRGRSLAVEVPVEIEREGSAVRARGALDLELRELGISPPSVAGVVKVANRFRLELDIRAVAGGRL